MRVCQSCGFKRISSEKKCPSCGDTYLTIAELIAEDEANEEKSSFKGRCKRIISAENTKDAFLLEVELIKVELTKKRILTIFLIVSFVFALFISVL
jgi:predicted ATP-dependent serine protease